MPDLGLGAGSDGWWVHVRRREEENDDDAATAVAAPSRLPTQSKPLPDSPPAGLPGPRTPAEESETMRLEDQ